MDMTGAIPSAPHSQSMKVYDENGVEFDALRGQGSITEEFFGYVDKNGGSSTWLGDWARAQGGSSWSSKPRAAKIAVSKNRDLDQATSYYWNGGFDSSLSDYEAQSMGSPVDQSMLLMHVYSYEIVSRVDMPQKNAPSRTVHLLRTESDTVLSLNGIEKNKPIAYKRGAVESTSIFQDVKVAGREMIEQDVPYHRVIGTYMIERRTDAGQMFLGDGENEFVVMLEGVEGTYTRRVGH